MDGRPQYVRIAEDLRTKIVNGTYPVGSELPSSSRLMQMYGVSVTVVRAAVRELRSEGLVRGQPGKAVYVVRQGEAPEPSPAYLEITRQIEALRGDLEGAVDRLDARLTQLEQSLPESRSPQQDS